MLFKQVRRTIDYYRLLRKGDRLIVGVSAGVDSMVLLHVLNGLLREFELSLIVAHLNHGLRPVESEKEAALVRQESLRLGLPFEYKAFNVKGYQEAQGGSLQDAGRRARLLFFHHLLKKYDGNKIAMGHHADDQVETILFRLLRGSGLKGLKGILPIREGKVIRPLLEVWKEEIEAFALENSIPYLIDSSNLKEGYLRNRLRLNLIPLIEQEYQPGFRQVLIRTSEILREEDDFIEEEAGEACLRMIHEEGGGISFRFSSYQSLHKAIQRRVIRKALERMEWTPNQDGSERPEVNMIHRRLRNPSASLCMELSHDLFLEKRYDTVRLKKEGPGTVPPFEVELPHWGRAYIPEIERDVLVEEREWDGSQPVHSSPNVALLDDERLHYPLRMRNFRPGDRFHPMGVGGTQKVKDFFINHKVPKFERPRIPLLISGGVIAWIAGYRIDEQFKVTPKTRRVLRVEII